MDKQFKSGIPAYFKAAGEEGIVEAIVSVFGNKDSYGDVVLPGAFSASLARKMPIGVYMHDWSMPIAKTMEARELLPGDPLLPDSIKDNGGLYIKGQLIKGIQKADEALLLMKEGVIDEFSFGYYIPDGGSNYDSESGTNFLTNVDMVEWSPVVRGANPATVLMAVKEDKPELTNDEKFFRTLSRLKNLTPAMVKAAALSDSDRVKVQECADMLAALSDAGKSVEEEAKTDAYIEALRNLKSSIKEK